METFTENSLRRNFALHFTSYLSIALSKILPHAKITKNPKKLSLFGENDSCRLSNFLQIHIFLNFDDTLMLLSYTTIFCFSINVWKYFTVNILNQTFVFSRYNLKTFQFSIFFSINFQTILLISGCKTFFPFR